MPELLFRVKAAHMTSPGLLLWDFCQMSKLIEDFSFLSKSEGFRSHLTRENSISDKDYIINSNLYFNSLSLKCSYLLALLRELSKEHENLVLVADPLIEFNLKGLLKQEQERRVEEPPLESREEFMEMLDSRVREIEESSKSVNEAEAMDLIKGFMEEDEEVQNSQKEGSLLG